MLRRSQHKRVFSCAMIAAIMLSMITACGASSNPSLPASPSNGSLEAEQNSGISEFVSEIPLDDVRALYTGTAEGLNEHEQALYHDTVLVLLQEDLWTSRDMYDACHYLMIPMHYAFRAGDTETIQLFADFFVRFADDVSGNDQYGFQEYSYLHRAQFYYLCTQFMCLCAANGREALIPERLPALAQDCASNYLLHNKANWGTEPTVIEHMRQVLAGKQYQHRYYSLIEDLDGFTLAILCDLNCLVRLLGNTPDEVTVTAAELSYELYASPLLNQETELGGWLMQAGAWSDHSSFAYAGNTSIHEGMEKSVRDDVPWDTSHFTRWPLYLNSYMSAQTKQDGWELFALRKEQLANQMIHYVLKNVDGHWLTTTFMDGTNGVYRYNEETGLGLQGYGLSGTFLLGWWSMLEDSRMTAVYQDILKTFPMEGNPENPYFDVATTREQNPFFDMDTAFENGMFECIVTCASKLS